MTRALLFIAVLLSGCAVPVSPVRELPLSVSKGQFTELDAELFVAADAWNDIVGRNLVAVSAAQGDIVLTAMSFRVMGEQPSLVAIAETRWSSRGIREGTISLRDDLVASSNTSWRIAVLTHELGHALGLKHEDNPRSVMFYAVQPGATISVESVNSLHEQYNYLEN